MQPSSLKSHRAQEKIDSDSLRNPGDFYIRSLPIYNSSKVIHAIILKCPYCGMEMASTGIHRISLSRFKRFFSHFGFKVGVTVSPKLVCPYNPQHSFSITNGQIKATK